VKIKYIYFFWLGKQQVLPWLRW